MMTPYTEDRHAAQGLEPNGAHPNGRSGGEISDGVRAGRRRRAAAAARPTVHSGVDQATR